jgi:lipopolysaccharide/colanic/teichoic acid biosynthesis glycosyltransferase
MNEEHRGPAGGVVLDMYITEGGIPVRENGQGGGGAFTAAAAVAALFFCIGTLLTGIWVEEQIWGSPGAVSIRQAVFASAGLSLISMQTTGAFRIGRRRLFEIAFSLFVSVVIINLGMISLPFFHIHYVRSPYTAAAIAGTQLILLWIWAVVFHRLYFRVFPRRPAVVAADCYETAAYCAEKILKHSREFTIVLTTGWDGYTPDAPPHAALIACGLDPGKQVEMRERCLENAVELLVIPGLWELSAHKSRSIQFGDMLALRFRNLGLTWEQRALKRFLDIVISLLASVTLLLPVAVLAAIVFLQDRRNPLFSQERLTRDGRVFRLYKLRTMITDAERHSGPVLAAYKDPRTTPFGRFLRRSRLDELPQFINVLKGDMSIVGPRPERTYFHELYSSTVPEYNHRLTVKAGITGMAHVYGRYDTPPEERIRLDLHYILNYSLLLDIKIMIETGHIMLSRSYAEGLKGKRDEERSSPHGEEIHFSHPSAGAATLDTERETETTTGSKR